MDTLECDISLNIKPDQLKLPDRAVKFHGHKARRNQAVSHSRGTSPDKGVIGDIKVAGLEGPNGRVC